MNKKVNHIHTWLDPYQNIIVYEYYYHNDTHAIHMHGHQTIQLPN